jgi:hypothetical protein
MKLCWLYRKAISWAADSQAQVPRWVKPHLLACPDCRRFQQGEMSLSTRLTADAKAHVAEFPPVLHARIMSTLRTEAAKPAQRVLALRWIEAALIPALGALMIAAYCVSKPGGSHESPSYLAASPGASALQTLIPQSPQSDPSQLLAWTGKLDQPLQSELDFVVSDAKTALQSLAENFLPSR